MKTQLSFASAMAGTLRFCAYCGCLLAVHIFTEHEVLCAKGLKRTPADKYSYIKFSDHFFHHLNVTLVGSRLVHKVGACAMACVDNLACFSFNLAAHRDANGLFLCELLASDKYNFSSKFRPHPGFHHYSIHVSSNSF